MFDLVIRNGEVARAKGSGRLDVGITAGKVAALLEPASGAHLHAGAEIDARGMIILPGLVDPHVHGGVGEPDRETIRNVSRAAAAGGITTILDQPLSNPSTVTLERVQAKRAEMERESAVDFGIWGGLIPGHVGDLDGMFGAGAQAFKAFMCRCSNYPMTDDGLLLKGMLRIGGLGGLVAVHAENDTLIQQLVDDLKEAGRLDAGAFLESHPEYSELEAVLRFIFIARQAPACKGHIVHASMPGAVEAVRRAREEGVDVTIETCPQYLSLTGDDMKRIGGVAKCDPPPRSRESVEMMWECVLNGWVDMIASDHSPHTLAKKTSAGGSFWTIAEGVTGVQTLLPVVVTEGRKRGLTWAQVAEVCSTNPAKRFGLYGRKGDVEVGFDADLVIFDPATVWTLEDEDLFYVNKHSPYSGMTFKGKVSRTIVRGAVVYDGERHAVTIQPGYGRFYPMDISGRGV